MSQSATSHAYFRSIAANITNGNFLNIFGSLLDPVTGLFVRTPILLLIFIYFVMISRFKNKKWINIPFTFFIGEFLIITIQGGWSAAAYGGRMHISSLIFFALVLGYFLRDIKTISSKLMWSFVLFFMLTNFVSFALFVLRDKGAEGGSRGIESRTITRIVNIFGKYKDSDSK